MLLVRHGQTATTGVTLPGRAPGLHLAEAGRDEAADVAGRIARLPRVFRVIKGGSGFVVNERRVEF